MTTEEAVELAKALQRMTRRFLPPNEAHDVAGDIFIRMYQRDQRTPRWKWVRLACLNHKLKRQRTSELGDYHPAPSNGSHATDGLDVNNIIKGAQLSVAERIVIYERFFLEKTQHDVARSIGSSQGQVSKLEAEALAKLRTFVERQENQHD
jgi:DNA-directed RNA polymerase specialized sigma subunit